METYMFFHMYDFAAEAQASRLHVSFRDEKTP